MVGKHGGKDCSLSKGHGGHLSPHGAIKDQARRTANGGTGATGDGGTGEGREWTTKNKEKRPNTVGMPVRLLDDRLNGLTSDPIRSMIRNVRVTVSCRVGVVCVRCVLFCFVFFGFHD